MRLISQDGMYDFPYESVALEVVNEGKSINAKIDYHDGFDGFRLADYSSSEKTMKVMEKLHYSYTANFIYHLMSEEEKKQFLILNSEKIDEIVTKMTIFRFPCDD